MRIAIIIASAALLAACDKPSTPPPVEPAPAVAPAPAEAQGLSVGLVKRPEFPSFYLDHIGPVDDALNNQPAKVPADAPLRFDGFGVDGVAKKLAKAVELVIDGKIYPTDYGSMRPDVGRFFKDPALSPSGFSTTLPAGTIAPGPHAVTVRVIAADGLAYFESPAIRFEIE